MPSDDVLDDADEVVDDDGRPGVHPQVGAVGVGVLPVPDGHVVVGQAAPVVGQVGPVRVEPHVHLYAAGVTLSDGEGERVPEGRGGASLSPSQVPETSGKYLRPVTST